MAHLPVPVAWLGMVGRRQKLAHKRRHNVEVARVEEDGEQRSLQRLQVGEMASPERRRPWRGRPGLGGAGATAATIGDRRRARARGRRPEACPAGLRLPTRLWGVWECWMVLEEAGGGSIYKRAARVLRAPPVDTCPGRPATSSVSERGRRRRSSHGNCWRTETSTGTRRRRRAQCAPHCWVGRTMPVLAAASSGVGK